MSTLAAKVVQPADSVSPSWRGFTDDLPREHGFEPLRIEGRLPADLCGTLYRNGPALSDGLGSSYAHLFDGDGAVSAVRFSAGAACGAVRLVQTRGLTAERAAGRRLYACFATPATSWWRALGGQVKNSANTSVVVWGERLLALFEGGLPTEIDPTTLATIGETRLEGAVPATFSAHPHRVDRRRAIYNFGMRPGRRSWLDLFELSDAGRARRLASLPLSSARVVHDFIATDDHLIFFISPVTLRELRQLLGIGTVLDNLRWQPELGTEVIVVPIDDPERPVRFHVDAFHVWHFANASSKGDELIVDYVRFADFGSIDVLRRAGALAARPTAVGQLHRARIDLRRRRLGSEPLREGSCEFPAVAPATLGTPAAEVYLAAHSPGCGDRGPFDALVAVDPHRPARARLVGFGADRYPSEPVVAPKRTGPPGAGYLLTLVYDAVEHRSHIAVLDTQALEKGVLARAWFDHHIPMTFHGTWVETGPG